MQPHVKMLWVATRKVIWEILGLITGLAGSGWPSTCQQFQPFLVWKKTIRCWPAITGLLTELFYSLDSQLGSWCQRQSIGRQERQWWKASKGEGGGSLQPNRAPHGQILTLPASNGLQRLQKPMAIEVRRKRRSGSFSSFTPLNLIYDWKCAGFMQEKPATGWSNCQNLPKCFRSALVEQVDWVQQVVAHP